MEKPDVKTLMTKFVVLLDPFAVWLKGLDAMAWATLTTAVATVVIALATIYYARLTHRLLDETRKQILLGQVPVVRIIPEDIFSHETAQFTLSVLNSGVAGLEEVNIYADYFVAMQPQDQPMRFYTLGGSQAPTHTIPKLASRQKADFHLTFRDIYHRMGEVYIDPKLADPGLGGVLVARMNIVRLSVEYRRVVDGRSFTAAKVYGIGGNANTLSTERVGTETAFPKEISFERIKAALGVRE